MIHRLKPLTSIAGLLLVVLMPALQGCAGTPDPSEAPSRAAAAEDTLTTGSRISRRAKAPTSAVVVKEAPALDASSQGGTSKL